MGIIYSATNKINGKIYIGQTTSSLAKRKYGHELTTRGGHFYKAIKKYGKDNFEWKIEKYCVDKGDLNNSEIQLIKKYNARDPNFGYNLTIGGEGTSGVVVNLITRLKLRKVNLGKKYSKETIEKKIATRKATDEKNGYHNSPEALAKMRIPRIPREIRFCGCGCGYEKEVKISSTWKFKHGHNRITEQSKERALKRSTAPKIEFGQAMKDSALVDKQLLARGLKRIPIETRRCVCTPDCRETFVCKINKSRKYKNNNHRYNALRKR